MARFLFALFALLTCVRLLCAEPLDRRQLPAGTAWVVHLDVEAAKSSSVVQDLYAAWSDQPEVRNAIARARAATGMDLTREIRSLTLYGLGYSPGQTVLIVRGKVDRPRLQSLLDRAPNYHRETVQGYELHHWTEILGAARVSRTGAFVNAETVAISPDEMTLIAALDVLNAKAPSLSSDSPLALEARDGMLLQVAATGFAEAKNLPLQSPILRQCESLAFVLGERDGNVFFHGKLVTRLPETAVQVKSAIETWRIFAARTADKPQSELVQSLKAEENDKTVDVDWTAPAKELVKIIKVRQSNRSAEVVREKNP